MSALGSGRNGYGHGKVEAMDDIHNEAAVTSRMRRVSFPSRSREKSWLNYEKQWSLEFRMYRATYRLTTTSPITSMEK